LITSTFLSLLVIPVVFTYVDDAVQWLKRNTVGRLHHHHQHPAGGASAAVSQPLRDPH
jgi:hypothetical protein